MDILRYYKKAILLNFLIVVVTGKFHIGADDADVDAPGDGHAISNIHLTYLCWTCSFLLTQVSQRNLILVSESVERLNTQDMEGLPQRKSCSLTQKQTSFLFLAANDFARTVELVESDTQTICVVTES